MKKLTPIAFVLFILFNTMGYYVIFIGLHYQNDQAIAKALDANEYDRSNTITLKVPVSIPYLPDQMDFNRVTGQFEYNGELLRLVKQRYAKDTLTIVCIRDTEHEKIDQALADYVKTFTDNAPDTKPASKLTVSFIKDFLPIAFNINVGTEGWTQLVFRSSHYPTLIPDFCSSIIHPPEKA